MRGNSELTLHVGEAKHVVQGILVAGGMFAKRSKDDKPADKLQTFMSNIWWPGSAGRVPTSVRLIYCFDPVSC